MASQYDGILPDPQASLASKFTEWGITGVDLFLDKLEEASQSNDESLRNRKWIEFEWFDEISEEVKTHVSTVHSVVDSSGEMVFIIVPIVKKAMSVVNPCYHDYASACGLHMTESLMMQAELKFRMISDDLDDGTIESTLYPLATGTSSNDMSLFFFERNALIAKYDIIHSEMDNADLSTQRFATKLDFSGTDYFESEGLKLFSTLEDIPDMKYITSIRRIVHHSGREIFLGAGLSGIQQPLVLPCPINYAYPCAVFNSASMVSYVKTKLLIADNESDLDELFNDMTCNRKEALGWGDNTYVFVFRLPDGTVVAHDKTTEVINPLNEVAEEVKGFFAMIDVSADTLGAYAHYEAPAVFEGEKVGYVMRCTVFGKTYVIGTSYYDIFIPTKPAISTELTLDSLSNAASTIGKLSSALVNVMAKAAVFAAVNAGEYDIEGGFSPIVVDMDVDKVVGSSDSSLLGKSVYSFLRFGIPLDSYEVS
eukprot:TRINITY_DN665_c0_g3_i3.p1 TRINITY_DN665_c0_g3~~TRINITY_DN665_c0_g3_i3.p1  ORF type:complete len:532 (+),score=155.42 TRINITY_DN665_c0_g3_i3:156-1598(+)